MAEALRCAGTTFKQPAKMRRVQEKVSLAKRVLDMTQHVVPALAVQALQESADNEASRERIKQLEKKVAAQEKMVCLAG